MGNETLTEPSLLLPLFLMWGCPFVAYYLGIYIRFIAMPSTDSPPLKHQFLMGVPVCLIVVTPIISTLNLAGDLSTNMANYLFTMGVIIEHGMLMHETLTKRLATLKSKPSPV